MQILLFILYFRGVNDFKVKPYEETPQNFGKNPAARVVLHSMLQLFSEKSCIETETTPKPSTKRL